MRKTRKMVLGITLALGLLLATSGSALAFHCYVENKPGGAGAGTFDDIKEAGNSGNMVYTGGAFADFGIGVDIFVRGQPVDVGVQGIGTLPSQPHESGGSNGVQSLPEPE